MNPEIIHSALSRRDVLAITAGLTLVPFAQTNAYGQEQSKAAGPRRGSPFKKRLKGTFQGGAYDFCVFESGLVVAHGHGVNRIGIGKADEMEFPNGDESHKNTAYWAHHLQGDWIDYVPDDQGKAHGSSGTFRIRWAFDTKSGDEFDIRTTFLVNGARFQTGEGGMIENEKLKRTGDVPPAFMPKFPIIVNNGWVGSVTTTDAKAITDVGDALVFSGPGYGYLAKTTERQYLFNGFAIPPMKTSNAPVAGDLIAATVTDPISHRAGLLRLEFTSALDAAGVLALENPKSPSGFDIANFKAKKT